MNEGYVLKVNYFRDDSFVVRIFACKLGVISGIVSIPSKSRTQQIKSSLQIGNKIEFDIRQGANLGKIFSIETLETPISFDTKILLCVSYMNEILLKLISEGAAVDELYSHYESAIKLIGLEEKRELVLRSFEQALFEELGVSVDFSWDYQKEEKIHAERYYELQPGSGLVETQDTSINALSGQALLQLVDGPADSRDNLILRKKINRLIIDELLEGKPLNSRQAYKSYLA